MQKFPQLNIVVHKSLSHKKLTHFIGDGVLASWVPKTTEYSPELSSRGPADGVSCWKLPPFKHILVFFVPSVHLGKLLPSQFTFFFFFK